MDVSGWSIVFVLIGAFVIWFVIMMLMGQWQTSKMIQERIKASAASNGTKQYQRLHEENQEVQQQILREIEELKTRIGSIERLLREVE